MEPGSKIGKYEVMGMVGRGGMGVVYKAMDPKIGRLVAIKMDFGLAAVLLDWRARCPYNQEEDWMFASADKHGKQPL